ncbi:MAG: GNAT family N-acetyltransferase [Verrucomicrobiota bacterium]|nr:GNAT family N-acetyltransferase [Verrucomicrobiota bacterium]
MHRDSNIPVPEGIVRAVDRAYLQNSDAWRQAFRGKVKDHRFYEIIEETLACDFEHRYLMIEDHSGKVRAVQPLFFVQQNIAEGVPGKIRSAIALVRRAFPRFLTMRVLMVGCAAGEGHLGACLPDDEEWVAEALHASLKIYARRCKASLVVLKDFPARYRDTLRSFSNNGYTRVASMPMTRLLLPYADFDGYLNSLGKSTRKDLRRKFRKTEKAAPIELEVVKDVTPYVEEVYPLYTQVHERSQLKFERLTKDYFCSLGQQMPERTRFFIWRQLGKVVAFSLCMVNAGTIYDDYLGLDYSVALDLHLYFYTLRDIIKWSLEQGLDCYCSSPLNYHPKLHLGCDLMPLDLYVMHTAAFVNPIFRRAVKFLGPTRHDPVLLQFPNAHQL